MSQILLSCLDVNVDLLESLFACPDNGEHFLQKPAMIFLTADPNMCHFKPALL